MAREMSLKEDKRGMSDGEISDKDRRRLLFCSNIKTCLPHILLLLAACTHAAGAWRVIHLHEQRARHLRELDQSGWRILAPAAALPTQSPYAADRDQRQRTDVNIVSVSTPLSSIATNATNVTSLSGQWRDRWTAANNNKNNSTLNKPLVPSVEWDDDVANEADPFENLRLPPPHNIKSSTSHLELPHLDEYKPAQARQQQAAARSAARTKVALTAGRGVNELGDKLDADDERSARRRDQLVKLARDGEYFMPTSQGSLARNNHYKIIYHGQLRPSNGSSSSTTAKRVVVPGTDESGEDAEALEFHINTHKPLAISRRSSSSFPQLAVVASEFSPLLQVNKNRQPTGATKQETREGDKSWADIQEPRVESPKVPASSTPSGAGNTRPTTLARNVTASYDVASSLQAAAQEVSGSSSDWRPIVVATSGRTRRSGKTHKSSSPLSPSQDSGAGEPQETLGRSQDDHLQARRTSSEHKWKPIKSKAPASALLTLGVGIKDEPSSEIGDEKPTKSRQRASPSSTRRNYSSSSELSQKRIEQPFDRFEEDEEEGARQEGEPAASVARSLRDARSGPEVSADRWTPLETTTQATAAAAAGAHSSQDEPSTTTTARPTGAGNGTEAAQRSASDLNYIYSSQPMAQQQQQQQLLQQQQTNAGAAYYSNYLVSSPTQTQQQQQQQQTTSYGGQQMTQEELPPQVVASTLVDNTSGQTPEMVEARAPAPLEPQPAPYGGYSQLQSAGSIGAFQPAMALPASRQPAAFYGNYANSYDTSSSYYNSMRALQPQPQAPQPQPPVRLQPQPTTPQVIRQEHHYHYHTQPPPPQQPAAERQVAVQSSANAAQQTPAPTIIRELQPIMISQPVIQQQQQPAPLSSTPAPTQVIREIIREVPATQTVQPVRFVMAPEPVVQQPQPQVVRLQMPPPPPPMISIPQMPAIVRDSGAFEPAGAHNYNYPAKRLMRQLIMPQVAIRMPPMPQFRLQVPAIQLPAPLRAVPNLAPVTRQTGSYIIPPMPKKTTTLMTETQAMPTHTTIMQTTQFTPATRTTVYTTDHHHQTTGSLGEPERAVSSGGGGSGYKARKK